MGCDVREELALEMWYCVKLRGHERNSRAGGGGTER